MVVADVYLFIWKNNNIGIGYRPIVIFNIFSAPLFRNQCIHCLFCYIFPFVPGKICYFLYKFLNVMKSFSPLHDHHIIQTYKFKFETIFW